jgi:hypothetical protein
MLRRPLLLLGLLGSGLAAAPAQAAITVNDAQATEGGKVAFTVTSDTLALGVQITVADGTAKSGSDYDPPETETINFSSINGGTQTVEVPTRADADPEMDETFTLTATPPGQTPDSGTGTIRNDDQPSLSLGDVSVAENAGSATLTIASQPVSADVSVAFATADDTANGTDYTASTGRVTIPAGRAGATIAVPIADDTVDEDDERLKVTLSAPTGAKVADGEGSVTITNDDGRLVSIGDVGIVEGDAEQAVARFPLQLSGPTFRTVSVAFVTVDGTAKAPRDYLARFGAVVFQPGQTTQFLDIAIASDEVREPDEFFGVLIGQASGARILRGSAVAAVRDDDHTATSAGADTKPPRMSLSAPRLSGSRSIRAKVTCPRGEQRCRGRLVLYTKLGRRERRIGASSFALPGDAARTLRVTIPRSILAGARRRGRLAVRAYLVTRDAAGNVDTRTTRRTLRVRRSPRR